MVRKNMERIDEIVTRYLNNRIITACAVGLSRRDEKKFAIVDLFWGVTGRGLADPPVDKNTFFDVASLTKPLVTLLCLLSLIRQGKTDFSEDLATLLPCVVPEDKKEITLLQLIGHLSGLPAHRKYYQKKKPAQNLDPGLLCCWILDEPLACAPGEEYIYSDLDYMLLGRIIEHKSGEDMGAYWRREIVDPLKLGDEFHLYGEPVGSKKNFVSTGGDGFEEDEGHGQVHDDNCRAAGRVLGHAGLFSTLHGVVSLCNCILQSCLEGEGHPAYRDSDMRFLLAAGLGNRWACGFDVRTGEKPSSGTFFSERSIGHLGFTGTSLWIDLEKKLSVVLLTNRVIYGQDASGIRQMRPLLHDAAIEALSPNVI